MKEKNKKDFLVGFVASVCALGAVALVMLVIFWLA